MSALERTIAIALGARLRELRVAAALRQQDIADRTGIHRPIVARIERGTHAPNIETITRYAMALGVPAIEVLRVLDAPAIAIEARHANGSPEGSPKALPPTSSESPPGAQQRGAA